MFPDKLHMTMSEATVAQIFPWQLFEEQAAQPKFCEELVVSMQTVLAIPSHYCLVTYRFARPCRDVWTTEGCGG